MTDKMIFNSRMHATNFLTESSCSCDAGVLSGRMQDRCSLLLIFDNWSWKRKRIFAQRSIIEYGCKIMSTLEITVRAAPGVTVDERPPSYQRPYLTVGFEFEFSDVVKNDHRSAKICCCVLYGSWVHWNRIQDNNSDDDQNTEHRTQNVRTHP